MKSLSKSALHVSSTAKQSKIADLTQTFTQIKPFQSKLKEASNITDVSIIQVDIGKAFQALKGGIQQLKNIA